jgi:hypothetical protein
MLNGVSWNYVQNNTKCSETRLEPSNGSFLYIISQYTSGALWVLSEVALECQRVRRKLFRRSKGLNDILIPRKVEGGMVTLKMSVLVPEIQYIMLSCLVAHIMVNLSLDLGMHYKVQFILY